MNFRINKVILWMKNETKRVLKFEANKINIITGDSETGKTALLGILDYCFFSDKIENITQEEINENVEWYGLDVHINNKNYIFARKAPEKVNNVSKEYFFTASINSEKPETNIDGPSLKKILGSEFKIDNKFKAEYGGDSISKNSRFSIRDILRFNTQEEDTIASKKYYYDRLDKKRDVEANERIFDLILGIRDLSEISLIESMDNLKNEIEKIRVKIDIILKENPFEKEFEKVALDAKRYSLIPENLNDKESIINELRLWANGDKKGGKEINHDDFEKLQSEKRKVLFKIRKINNFQKSFDNYIKLLKKTKDSLAPINIIKENFIDILEDDSTLTLLESIEKDFVLLKDSLSRSSPIKMDFSEELELLHSELISVESQLKNYQIKKEDFNEMRERFLFVGRLLEKIELFEKRGDVTDLKKEKIEKEKGLELLKENTLMDIKKKRKEKVKFLEKLITKYARKLFVKYSTKREFSGVAFDYKTKKPILLLGPNMEETEIMGSSSNYLYLHICLFLGLNEYFINQKIENVPSFILLDQPSRPYYADAAKVSKKGKLTGYSDLLIVDHLSDQERIKAIFKQLNGFMKCINKKYRREFQFIILEHVPEEVLKSYPCEHIHIVEDFRNGNALILPENKKEKPQKNLNKFLK